MLLTVQPSTALYTYVGSAARADQDITDIAGDVALTANVLDCVGNVFKEDDAKCIISKAAVRDASSIIQRCEEVFKEIDHLVEKRRKVTKDGKKTTTLGKLMWPMKEPRVELLRRRLDSLKTSLLVLLEVLRFAGERARGKVEQSAMEQEREKIRQLHQRQQDSLRSLQALESKLCGVSLNDNDDGDNSTLQGSTPPSRAPTVAFMLAQPVAEKQGGKDENKWVGTMQDTQAVMSPDEWSSSDDETADVDSDNEAGPVSVEDLVKCTKHVQSLLKRINSLQSAFQTSQPESTRHSRKLRKLYMRFCHKFESDVLKRKPNITARPLSTLLPPLGQPELKRFRSMANLHTKPTGSDISLQRDRIIPFLEVTQNSAAEANAPPPPAEISPPVDQSPPVPTIPRPKFRTFAGFYGIGPPSATHTVSSSVVNNRSMLSKNGSDSSRVNQPFLLSGKHVAAESDGMRSRSVDEISISRPQRNLQTLDPRAAFPHPKQFREPVHASDVVMWSYSYDPSFRGEDSDGGAQEHQPQSSGNGNSAGVQCTHCTLWFTRVEDLERHTLTHTLPNSFKCSQCPMSFPRSDLLQRHGIIHGQGAGNEESEPDVKYPKRAGRTPIACSNCAKTMVRCDRKYPCSRCSRYNLKCTTRATRRSKKMAARQVVSPNRTATERSSSLLPLSEDVTGPFNQPHHEPTAPVQTDTEGTGSDNPRQDHLPNAPVSTDRIPDTSQEEQRTNSPYVLTAAPPSNHALQDYEMQLMLLEQGNRKRLLLARQEQDNLSQGASRQHVQNSSVALEIPPQRSPVGQPLETPPIQIPNATNVDLGMMAENIELKRERDDPQEPAARYPAGPPRKRMTTAAVEEAVSPGEKFGSVGGLGRTHGSAAHVSDIRNRGDDPGLQKMRSAETGPTPIQHDAVIGSLPVENKAPELVNAPEQPQVFSLGQSSPYHPYYSKAGAGKADHDYNLQPPQDHPPQDKSAEWDWIDMSLPDSASRPGLELDSSAHSTGPTISMPIDSTSPSITCTNCYSQTTPLWRYDQEGRPLCNPCGLFLKLHGVARPLSLKADVVKKRNRGIGELVKDGMSASIGKPNLAGSTAPSGWISYTPNHVLTKGRTKGLNPDFRRDAALMRVSQACRNCRVRKQKCDDNAPCRPCVENYGDDLVNHPCRGFSQKPSPGGDNVDGADYASLAEDDIEQRIYPRAAGRRNLFNPSFSDISVGPSHTPGQKGGYITALEGTTVMNEGDGQNFDFQGLAKQQLEALRVQDQGQQVVPASNNSNAALRPSTDSPQQYPLAPYIYHTPQSNSPATVLPPLHNQHDRPIYGIDGQMQHMQQTQQQIGQAQRRQSMVADSSSLLHRLSPQQHQQTALTLSPYHYTSPPTQTAGIATPEIPQQQAYALPQSGLSYSSFSSYSVYPPAPFFSDTQRHLEYLSAEAPVLESPQGPGAAPNQINYHTLPQPQQFHAHSLRRRHFPTNINHGVPSLVGPPGMPAPAPHPRWPKLKFTKEDEELLISLKEDKKLSWSQIADFFPGRSSGTLQVRYVTKLKRRHGDDLAPLKANSILPARETSHVEMPFASTDDANSIDSSNAQPHGISDSNDRTGSKSPASDLQLSNTVDDTARRETTALCCVPCRKKHLKCDGAVLCSRCKDSGEECTYIKSRRGWTGKRKDIDKAEQDETHSDDLLPSPIEFNRMSRRNQLDMDDSYEPPPSHKRPPSTLPVIEPAWAYPSSAPILPSTPLAPYVLPNDEIPQPSAYTFPLYAQLSAATFKAAGSAKKRFRRTPCAPCWDKGLECDDDGSVPCSRCKSSGEECTEMRRKRRRLRADTQEEEISDHDLELLDFGPAARAAMVGRPNTVISSPGSSGTLGRSSMPLGAGSPASTSTLRLANDQDTSPHPPLKNDAGEEDRDIVDVLLDMWTVPLGA